MTTQSAHPQPAAGPTRPTPAGLSSRALAGRHSAAPGAELAAALRRGTGYDRCYDLLAPQLYRYCWALLGPGGSAAEPDRAAAALRETYLTAAHSIGELRDDREFAAWLFALARTAARRRGFTARSPYAQVPTTAAERAIVQLSIRLPPSHRELLELYLRHGLPAARIARVLGLSEETSGELCRAAVLRAAELLTRHSLAPDRTGRHGPDRGVRAVLADLEPPGPPLALRGRVVDECASAQAADERRAAAAALAPLGEDGFPLHRNRTPAAAGNTGSTAEEENGGAGGPGTGCGPAASGEPTALPRDRVTTGDVPTRAEPEPVAKADDAAASAPHRPRRRWLIPATAALASATVVAGLWGTVAMVRTDTGDTVTGSGLPAAPTAAPSDAAPDTGTGTEGGETSAADRPRPEPLDDATLTPPEATQPGAAHEPGQPGSATAPGAPGADPSAAPGAQGQGEGPDQGQGQGQGQQEGAEGADSGAGSAGQGQEDGEGSESGGSDSDPGGSGSGGSDGSGGPVSGLIGGLIDLFSPGG